MHEKMFSRKLWVFLIWTIILIVALLKAVDIAFESFLQWYGPISITYMLGQTAVDFIAKAVKRK